ncbi:MAG: M16 family metallopeptidase [Gemmatimonadota bacterium]
MKTRVIIAGVLSVLLALALSPAEAAAQEGRPEEIDIPFTRFVLDNGLTVIVHEDHKAPIVAVNVWYHVGSKNEKPGKTGFAHLFEHLMFNGSENYDDDYFQALEPLGATTLNGTTNPDRTNYFQNVPTSALDVALWMESDRMGHLLGAITQEKLDEQRGVVQNEKRQGENQPYGVTRQLLTENSYPAGHPYSWTTIGSMEDLDAATLDDVKEWFRTYYGAANAVVALAGDIDVETAREKMQLYFGDIPSGPPVARQDVWIARRTGSRREIVHDRVPQARLYKYWNAPEWGSEDATYLDLVSDVLSSGKTSRLFKRLVYDDELATTVSAFINMREIGSQFGIVATARPGVPLADVERAVDEELARFLAEGPTDKELRRVKTQYRANFIRGIETIGGFGGKSDILARNEVYGGRPDYYKTTNAWVSGATAESLRGAAERWLSDGVFVLEVHPFPQYTTAVGGADRSAVPVPGTPPDAHFPPLHRATLSNGLKIILAERTSVPQVNLTLAFDAGYAADQFGRPGTASLAMNMMDEGTESRSALELSEQLALLGARLSTGANLDMATVTMSALKENLDASLELFADVTLHPAFPAEDFARLQRRQLASIQQEKVQPVQMALRVFPALLYGKGHAYGNPLTGSGTEASVRAITREDLIRFHDTWIRPNNATLIVVGATTLEEIVPKLERLFRGWKAADVPTKNISDVEQKAGSSVYIIDRPGAIQSIIFAGHVAPPTANPDEITIQTMNRILGGSFLSRVNMNLREDKHWSYGAFTFLFGARGQRPFIVYAPVQTDRTKESLVETMKELEGIRGAIPVTPQELEKAKKGQTLTLPGQWETMGAVGGSIAQIVRYGLPDDYFETFAARVRRLDLSDVSEIARRIIHPDRMVWVVVGDRAKIEDGIRELDLGEVHLIDSDGAPVMASD